MNEHRLPQASHACPEGAVTSRCTSFVGIALVLISAVIFGSTPAVYSYLRGTMALVDVITYRGLMAAVIMFGLAALANRRRTRLHGPVPKLAWRQRNAGLMIGVLLYAPQLMLFYTAFDYLDTSLGVALGYVYPTIVVAIVALRLRRTPPKDELAVSLVAMVGIFALTKPGPGATVALTGVVLVLAASVLYAIYVVMAGDLVAHVPPLRVGGQVSGGVGFATAAYGLVTGTLGFPTGAGQWAGLFLQATMLVGGIATYYLGLARLGSSRASLIDTAQPVVAVIAGGWLLGERLAPVQLVGVSLVIASVLATTLLAHRKPAIPYADPP